MKKFKIIRNVLIIVIIIIAVWYMCMMKSNNIKNSRSYKIFDDMRQNTNKKITMQLSYVNENVDIFVLYASDDEDRKEIQIMEILYKEDMSKTRRTISTITKDGTEMIGVFPEEKSYRNFGIIDSQSTDTYDIWINRYFERMLDNKYYSRGYELVKGKLLYYEKFKASGLKFYFDKDELVYIKDTNLDEAYNNVNDVLYNVKITYDDGYKKFFEILNDYKEVVLNENDAIDNE